MSDSGAASTQFEPGAAPPGILPLCVPELRGNEWQYVKECLDTNWVSSVGPFVDRFELMVAEACGTKYSVATVNGTAALHVALLVAGVEPDDEVLVSDLTFIAPANAIRYAGAWPVLIDAEPEYWQMDPNRVVDFLESKCRWSDGKLINKTTGRQVKAIVPVHVLGHPVHINPILQVARKFELAIIEDATESLGAQYEGRPVGHLGDIACFSFNGNKIITTGAGGMIVTDNADWARRARYLTTQAKDDPVEYVHESIGYNYRLSNVQAAIGCAQMELLPEFIDTKRRNAARYENALKTLPGITTMRQAPYAKSVYWLNTILVDRHLFGEDCRSLMRKLAHRNIQTRPLWQPLHLSPVHRGSVSHLGEVACELSSKALSLPSSVGIQQEEIQSVIEAIEQVSKEPS